MFSFVDHKFKPVITIFIYIIWQKCSILSISDTAFVDNTKEEESESTLMPLISKDEKALDVLENAGHKKGLFTYCFLKQILLWSN